MLERDLEMACTKFHENWLIIDGEIDEKHALQIYQNKYVLDIERLAAILEICSLDPRGTIFFKVNIKIL